eukprot:scaffold1.g5445.t1
MPRDGQRQAGAAGRAAGTHEQRDEQTPKNAAGRERGLAMVTPTPARRPDAAAAEAAATAEAETRLQHLRAARAGTLEEEQRLEALLGLQAARSTRTRAELATACSAAQAQHARAAAALVGAADQLGGLLGSGDGGGLQALCLAPLDSAYSAQCVDLDRAVKSHLAAIAAQQPAAAAAAEQHVRQQRELQLVAGGLAEASRAEAAGHVAVARLTAELEALTAASGPLPLGATAAGLQQENAQLAGRLAEAMERAQGVAAAVAAAETGAVASAQCEARLRALRQRCEAKQRAAGVLTRQVARQLLALQLMRRELAAVNQVEATVAAAAEDASSVLCATQQRLQLHARSPAADEQQQQPPQQRGAVQEGAAVGEDDAEATEAAATVRELLACRSELRRLAERLQACAMPAQRESFASLYAALFEGGDPARPILTPAPLAERMAAAEAAAAELDKQAHSAIGDVTEQKAGGPHQRLANEVLRLFFTSPEELEKREAAKLAQLGPMASGGGDTAE